MRALSAWLLLASGCIEFSCVQAWGPDGHHTIAAIATKLIAGTNAATQVKVMLGDISLTDAAVWADCAKGVNPTTLKYGGEGRFPECAVFETTAGEAAMVDFVSRNATHCVIKPGEEICHKQYHYSDVAIQHDLYAPGFVGTRDDDIVEAVVAVTHVLKGDPAPAPFNIKDKKEALLLLAHYVGDIHQPLHVGAVYLDSQGATVNPDTSAFDPTTATRGGNSIVVLTSSGHRGKNLHATWDVIPKSQNMSHVGATWVTAAKAIPASTGSDFDWPRHWASDTVAQAKLALEVLAFGPLQAGDWTVRLPTGYSTSMSAIKKKQLTRAGARLAELLEDIFP